MNGILFLVFSILLFHQTSSARILAIVPTAAFSHQSTFRPIWEALAEKGHEITLITANPLNNHKNIKEIDFSIAYYIFNEKHQSEKVLHKIKGNTLKLLQLASEVREDATAELLKNEELNKLMQNKTAFDLLMIETAYPTLYGLSCWFDVPFIDVFSVSVPDFMSESLGNFVHPIVNPSMILPFAGELSFFERITSTLVFVAMKSLIQLQHQYQNRVMAEKFGDKCSITSEVIRRYRAMAFTYDNTVIENIRPVVPASISISGIHIQKAKQLPKDLQQFLDSSKNGVIYFSLGTSVKSKDIPDNIKKVITDAFSELPYDVLWKFELPKLDGKPENVRIEKWLPQQDVLRHPNIKLFITQGGLQSIEESLYSYVPMVVIPIAGDQTFNAKNIEYRGYGKMLNLDTLEKEEFKETILEVIKNPTYKETVKKMADLSLDQPMTSLERAVWWTEYVIRHKGAKHLKGPAADIPLYQYLLLDVIGFLLLVLIIVLYILAKIFKLIRLGIRKFLKKKTD